MNISFILKIKLLVINLIVVSDKMTVIKPRKKVKNLTFLYLLLSFEDKINKKEIKIKSGI
tara:strand:+ start:394 stop:573 length:180 start_codon:yes stop_codon:yes gene_type:complete